MGYIYLTIAIVTEIIGTSYLKETEGFTRLGPSIICVLAYIVCHLSFAKCLTRMNLSVGYAVWCGIGLVITTVVSVFVYKEKITVAGMAGVIFIIVGCVLVNGFGTK